MSKRLTDVLMAVWMPIAMVVAWWVFSVSVPSPYFPPLPRILERLQELWLFAKVPTDLVPSLTIFALGYLTALVIGISLGVLLAAVPYLEQVVDPFLQFMRALPGIALIPVFIVVLGIGMESKVAVVALGALWPILLNTIDGIRSTEPELVRTAKVYRFSKVTYVTRVMLSSAAPSIMAGARTSLAIALVLTVGAELYAATQGVGFFVLQSQQSFMIVDMWTGIIVLGVVGYLLTGLFTILERRFIFWVR